MRIYVKGFGCSSSLADAEVLAGCLSSAGHTIVSNLQDAELVLYNTCAVKAPTENRMIHLLKEVPKEKRLIVAGCLPLINFERLSKEVRFDGVVGPAFGEKIVDVVKQISKGMHVTRLSDATLSMPRLDLPHTHVNLKISIIPINYGCLGSCTYCCVRFARGKLRSYGIKEIVNKVEKDVAEGVREFWLTSQDTACYGKDVGTNLAELLRRVCGVSGDFFVRVGMMTPNNLLGIMDELREAFQSAKVFKFLHLPVQSGDDGILRRMNRFYSTKDFIIMVKRFKKVFPQSTIATDVIVGFPGETEEAFRHTRELIEDVRPDIVNISKFFARPKTLAASLKPRVPPSKVNQRSACLAGLVHQVAFERNNDWGGWSGRILVDEIGKPGSVVGRNFAYKPIVLKNGDGQSLLGRFVSVKVIDVFQSHLLGEIL
ncbi:MAG: tRNA (N(6)-L-threonylcarbamoyladenosine(37)-C(2))-methylthiotransferase [Candidatus Bathyarchaeota archaeon]|nr:tRNA (N(6)-L-threonylcarbamoyladenosine(37)-C(2))-methylthiotransferase [Candidatus Bathyarchaeota archaeon]MDH5494104.1 tRNA (N(6)-L-threonylcarbamoyladenosine(37)-C(2))-methylthiotransferase [Candidatus Bathyarchaeota archaeon]